MPEIRNIPLIKRSLKNSIPFLIILIFNNFLAQKKPEIEKNRDDNQSVISKKDTVKLQREQLDDIVKSKADYIRNDIPKKMSFLNKDAQVKYQDMQIDADYIQIDWDKGMIYARGKVDSTGKIIEPAVATQGGKKYEYKNFNYNYKTKQALAYDARTEESEGVIVAEITKKVNDSVFYLRKGKYTTDEYFLKKKDTIADYYLLAPHIKLIKGKNNSKIVTGPIQLYIEQVPTPLALPFAILPFSDKRTAGILPPSFGERQDVGFFINSLGYYQPIGEHFDFKAYVDFYTKGSWNFRPELNYRKNYKYNGSFRGEIGTTINGIKGLSNYSKSKVYNITWTHTQDTKANPYFSFSASVNITSNKFYNNSVNNNNIFNGNALNAQQNSSISFTKRFINLPITITGAGSYSQNFNTGLTDLRLPQLNVSINQFYLFKPKTGVRTGLIENINVNTGLVFSNYVSGIKNTEMFTPKMWENLQTGAKNNLSLGTNTTIAKYFTFSLGANIDNVISTKTITKSYNPITNKTDKILNKNISGFSTFSTSASLQTVLYGMLKFNRKDAKIQAIRHMVTPSVGFTYSPDFGKPSFGYFKNYYDERGILTNYSIFEGGMFGSPNSGLVQSIGFSIANNLEMKIKSKSDSTGVKKVKLFESLNISGGYNFAATSHKWSLISVSSQTSFFQNKLNVNSTVSLDPYQIIFAPGSESGTRTENFGHFNIQSINVSFSYPLSYEVFGKKDYDKTYKSKGEIRNEVYYFDEDNYARFSQPWSLNINANYGYSKNLTKFGQSVASVGLDGSLKLTPYWNLNGSTHYDFVSKSLAYTRLGFARDQRSFTFSFNWVPFGQYKVYDFFISIKANILKDAVKYKERSFNQNNSSF